MNYQAKPAPDQQREQVKPEPQNIGPMRIPPDLDMTQPILFADLGPRKVVADFSGGDLSPDAGVLLLRQIDRGLGVSRMLAGCFTDLREQIFVEHSLEELLAQRIYGLALG